MLGNVRADLDAGGMRRCPICLRNWSSSIQAHLMRYHCPEGAKSTDWRCGICLYSHPVFDEVATHCLDNGHDARTLHRPYTIEAVLAHGLHAMQLELRCMAPSQPLRRPGRPPKGPSPILFAPTQTPSGISITPGQRVKIIRQVDLDGAKRPLPTIVPKPALASPSPELYPPPLVFPSRRKAKKSIAPPPLSRLSAPSTSSDHNFGGDDFLAAAEGESGVAFGIKREPLEVEEEEDMGMGGLPVFSEHPSPTEEDEDPRQDAADVLAHEAEELRRRKRALDDTLVNATTTVKQEPLTAGFELMPLPVELEAAMPKRKRTKAVRMEQIEKAEGSEMMMERSNCTKCGMSVKVSGAFRKFDVNSVENHVLTHHVKEQPYKCSTCKRCFSINWNCRRHIKTQHANMDHDSLPGRGVNWRFPGLESVILSAMQACFPLEMGVWTSVGDNLPQFPVKIRKGAVPESLVKDEMDAGAFVDWEGIAISPPQE